MNETLTGWYYGRNKAGKVFIEKEKAGSGKWLSFDGTVSPTVERGSKVMVEYTTSDAAIKTFILQGLTVLELPQKKNKEKSSV